jgi:hypothetical protein
MSHAKPSKALRCPQYTNSNWILQSRVPPSDWVSAAAAANHNIQVRNKLENKQTEELNEMCYVQKTMRDDTYNTKWEATLVIMFPAYNMKRPKYAELKRIVQTETNNMYRTRARRPELGKLWWELYLAVIQAAIHICSKCVEKGQEDIW